PSSPPPGTTPTPTPSFRAGGGWRTCSRRWARRGAPGWTTPCCSRPHDRCPDQRGAGEVSMKPTRARTLVLTAVICAVGVWLLLRQVYTSPPLLAWSGVAALVLVAVAGPFGGRGGPPGARGRAPPTPPIAVARLAVLAKASSLAGAAIGGVAAGFLIYVLGSVDKSSAYRSDSFASGATLGAAALLVAAALYLEYGCRVPTNRDQRAEPGLPPQSGTPR